MRRLDAVGAQSDGVTLRRPSLDDVFLTLTGHAAEQGDTEDSSPPSGRSRRSRRRKVFAEHQPVTQVVDTMRALALGGPVVTSLWQAWSGSPGLCSCSLRWPYAPTGGAERRLESLRGGPAQSPTL